MKNVPSKDLDRFLQDLFHACGLSKDAAGRVAAALIEADLSGRPSHGVLQAENYLARLASGAMSTAEVPIVVSRSGGAIVLDAGDMEGHLAAEEAIGIAIEAARENGVAAVAVRRGQHTGVMGRYVRIAAQAGCAAVAMGNTRPVMPAPGGIERLVGTNPLAVGIPAAEGPIVLDMATSAGTYGRIRHAKAIGKPIPGDWALDSSGNPTTDPEAAMAGFLLPMAGAKGFALSFVIDLMARLFSGGDSWISSPDAAGASPPPSSSYIFIVLDVSRFRDLNGFLDETARAIERVRTSSRAEGVDRLFTPGERSAEALAHNDGTIEIAGPVADALVARARRLNVDVPEFLRNLSSP
ncbi:hypothetical protein ASD44_17530 [Mesorhizobium sp. Root554]|uniref:Ldh family oxidoreductase n=1 Tax=unclassified Mesorhizobium TaxID=325217 RepID=UPI0006FCFD13|nr:MULTISPECIES: Ldh family oxidoreductase [unclassified Mesorhizobium]KQZ15651.1 hypothetical protein ASD27_17535 [Mesorhizobium sp. Root1471]KQZ38159.1 hypothetical protein ASD44_17530 [Mesorhizobium sp. Root554]